MSDRRASRSNLRALGLRIALGLAIVGVLSGGWSFAMSGTTTSLRWWGSWLQDVGTEMLGAAVTILLVELVIYQKRDEASRLDQERLRRSEHFIEQLKRARSFEKRQKILSRMNQQNLLENAWLCGIDLSGVDLAHCNLKEVDLFEANLANAVLKEADLTEAILQRADLSYANLVGANLTAADLVEANLKGTDLTAANLHNADLAQAQLSTETRLPDGILWTSEVNLEQYVQSSSKNQ